VARRLDLESGQVTVESASRGETFAFDGKLLRALFGPRWRLLIIGAGQLSRAVAQMALALDFEVICCDPREEYHLTWDIAGTTFSKAMPDDLVLELQLDPHSAVIAVTHDPKLDDMVLLEALKSPAFYVGALGSRGNTAKRKERLALFDLTPAEIGRLHGPIGLDLGSKTPAEIAVSIVAEIIAVKNGIVLTQKKEGSAMPFVSGVCVRD
jgi:xanthine dehydrogenase accessory factor